MLASIQASIYIMKGEYERVAALSQQALEQLPQEMQLWRLIPVINLGFARQATGDFVEAEEAFSEAIQLAITIGSPYFALIATNALGIAQTFKPSSIQP